MANQRDTGAKKPRKKGRLTTFLLLAAMLVGTGLLAYPSFADYWNKFHQTQVIMGYAETVAHIDEAEFQRIINSALDYNQRAAESGLDWKLLEEDYEAYDAELNYTGNGVMGYIEISKIGVMLPVYHGTSDGVLNTSIGHLEGTSLPAGSRYAEDDDDLKRPLFGSHSVLSGHRGLPSARLFTDLDQLIEGDTFILNIMNEIFTYEVDQIHIVEPTELDDLAIEEGKDYCTLVTCTPYGVNTHRMLVRGHRVPNVKRFDLRIMADAILIDTIYVAPVIALPILLLLILWVMIVTSGRGRRRKRRLNSELAAHEIVSVRRWRYMIPDDGETGEPTARDSDRQK